jgi:hypothetical protein
MTKDTIYTSFYGLFFLLCICTGQVIGYRHSHTPPIPFFIELLVLPIGFLLFLIDLFTMWPVTFDAIKIHVWGLGANGLIMVIVLIDAFSA